MDKVNNTPQEIWTAINEARNIVIILDGRFDYDALGSSTAMKMLLDKLGKPCDVYYAENIPQDTERFGDFSFIIQNTHPNNIDYKKYDLLLVLDNGDPRHLANGEEVVLPADIKKIRIDHHTEGVDFADLQYIDTNAASTTRLVYELMKEWKVAIDQQTAKLLLLGLLTDSGRFQYPKTGSPELRMAAEIMEMGVDMYDLNYKLLFRESYASLKYKALIYNNLKVHFDEKYAYSSQTLEDLKKYDINPEDVKGFSPAADLIKYMTGVTFVFVVKEEKESPGHFKTSLRSHVPNYAVSKLAKALGGGGHKIAASTGLLEGVNTIEEAVKVVVGKAKELDAELWD